MKVNVLKLIEQEKFDELGDYISTKLSAAWIEMLQISKLFNLPAEQREEFSTFTLLEFAAETAQAAGFTKEWVLKTIEKAYDKAEETDDDNVDDDPPNKITERQKE